MTDHSKACTYLGADYDPGTSRISPAPYCGADSNGDSSYCEAHYPLVYNVGSGLRRRKKDIRVADSVWTLESLFHEAVAELESEGVEVV